MNSDIMQGLINTVPYYTYTLYHNDNTNTPRRLKQISKLDPIVVRLPRRYLELNVS